MLVDPERLIQPQEDFQAAFPNLGFRNIFHFNMIDAEQMGYSQTLHPATLP